MKKVVTIIVLLSCGKIAAQSKDSIEVKKASPQITMQDMALFYTLYHTPDGKVYHYYITPQGMQLDEVRTDTIANLKMYHHNIVNAQTIISIQENIKKIQNKK